MLRAGRLRHRVTVKRPSSTLGSRGQRSGDDTTILQDIPCSIIALSGREFEQARQTVAGATHKVEMYADPENPVTPLDYLEFGSRILWVRYAPDVGERGFEYALLCEEEI